MKSWDEVPQEWDHPDTVEFRKAYGPPVYNELYLRLRGGRPLDAKTSGEELRILNNPPGALDVTTKGL